MRLRKPETRLSAPAAVDFPVCFILIDTRWRYSTLAPISWQEISGDIPLDIRMKHYRAVVG
jgi:hypothetical protein